MEEQEKRNISRVTFRTNASLKKDNQIINGGIKDLSLKGVFIKTHEILEINSDVDVEIQLSGATTDLSVHVKGLVIRKADNGYAIQFKNIDLDSYIFLKNIIMYSNDKMIDIQY